MKTDKMKPVIFGPCHFDMDARTVSELFEPFRTVCNLEDSEFPLDVEDDHGEFIADAFTVFHETGLTPRQILEQRDELLKTLETYDGTNSSQRWKTFRKHALAAIQNATTKGDTPA